MAQPPAKIPRLAGTAAEKVPRLASMAAERLERRRLWERASSSRVVRLLLGDAIGDAFGFGIEMQDAAWIRQAVQRFDVFPQNPVIKEEFRENNVRGFYSDDAEMTVGLMKALREHGVAALDRDGMMAAWKREWDLARERPPPAVPSGERQGHGGVAYVWRGKTSLEEMRARQAKREDPGNAPPMRALPLAFLSPSHRVRLSVENADSTHPHPKARAASLLVAFAGRFMLEGGNQSDLLRAARDDLAGSSLAEAETLAHLRMLDQLPDFHAYGERYAALPDAVHEGLCGPQPCPFTADVPAGADGTTPMRGLFADAMRTAGVVLYILKHQTGPLDALKAAVDLGGDVDSVAALVLAVIGATTGLRFGEEGGLAWELLEGLEGVEYLVAEAKAFEAWLAEQPADVTGAPSALAALAPATAAESSAGPAAAESGAGSA